MCCSDDGGSFSEGSPAILRRPQSLQIPLIREVRDDFIQTLLNIILIHIFYWLISAIVKIKKEFLLKNPKTNFSLNFCLHKNLLIYEKTLHFTVSQLSLS